jgi:hypothetical protein
LKKTAYVLLYKFRCSCFFTVVYISTYIPPGSLETFN